MFSIRTIPSQLKFMLEKHGCFLGKSVRQSVASLTGGNNLGSGSCFFLTLKCLSDSSWDYWHWGWDKNVLAIAGYLAFLALRLYMPIACPAIVAVPSVPSPFPNPPTLLENQGEHILLKTKGLRGQHPLPVSMGGVSTVKKRKRRLD